MTEPEVEAEEKASRAMDPEILLLSRIARLLDDLDATGKARVIAYLSARYEAKP